MPKRVAYDFAGLVTNASIFKKPPGALTEATNVDLQSEGRLTKRFAFQRQPEAFGGPTYSIINSKVLGDNLLVNYGDATAPVTLRIGNGTAASSLVARVDGVGNAYPNTVDERMHSANALQNQYLTTSDGPIRIESDVASSLVGYFAGMPRPPGFDQTFVTGGTGGLTDATASGYGASANWLPNASSVAYRVCWVTTDADGVELVSPPSGRWVITNTAGAARAVTLRVLIPKQTRCTAAISITAPRVWKARVYRSPDSTGAPIDEMQLCFEVTPTAGNVAAGYLEFLDIAPNAALGAYLYTNTISGGDVGTTAVRSSSNVGDGILASNDYPPIAKDVASFRDCMFYGNLTLPPRLTFSILAVGTAGNVLKTGSKFTLNGGSGITIDAVALPLAANEFLCYTAGTATENIRNTAIRLVEAINRYSSTNALVVATYVGNDNSPGTIGRIMLEAKDGKTAFDWSISAGSDLPFIGLGDSVTESWGNGLAIAKPLQADAVPPANYLRIGRNDTRIKRLGQLGDSLFIFTDAGVWRVRGRTPNDFFIEEFDKTFRLLAPETLCECEDALYAWGVEGIARIDDSGVEFIDFPIRDTVRDLVATAGATQAPRAFAVAYRQRRRVVFCYPPGSSSFAASDALVWHLETKKWTQYDLANVGQLTCGAVRQTDDLLFFGGWTNPSADGYVFKEATATTSQPYTDVDRDDVGSFVFVNIAWAVAFAEVETLCDWHALEIGFGPGSFASLTGTVYVTHTTEFDTVSQTVTIGVSSPSGGAVMEVVPPTVALASRQEVRLTQSTENALTIDAMALIYTPISPLSAVAG